MNVCKYNYLVTDISEGEETGYCATIPKFPNLSIMADTPSALHKSVIETIEIHIKNLKKKNLPIPPPDKNTKFSGKVLLRIPPSLHEKLTYEAQANKRSLNKHIEQRLA